MLKWRLLVEDGRKTGRTYSQPDLISAATALHYGLTVVTRGTAEFTKARAGFQPVARVGRVASSRGGSLDDLLK